MTILQISLAAARVNAGLKQEEVAEKMGVSKRTVINWEKGKVHPSAATVNMLSDIYKVPIDCLLLPRIST